MGLELSKLENLFKEGNSFVDLLPYSDYYDEFFVLVDGSLGKIWELEMLECEAKSQKVLEEISKGIEGLLMQWPNMNIACQLILVSTDDIQENLSIYQKFDDGGEKDNIAQVVFKEKLEHFENNKKGFFDYKNLKVFPRKLKLYFTLRYFPSWVHPTLKDKVSFSFMNQQSLESKMKDDYLRHKEKIKKCGNAIETVFRICSIKHSCVNGEDLVNYLYKVLNPKRSKKVPYVPYNFEESIRNQVVYNCPKAGDEGFELENYYTKVVSLKELPNNTFTGMFSLENYNGGRACLFDLVKNFMFVVNFVVPSQSEALKMLKLQKGFAFAQRATFLGDQAIEAIEKRKELDNVIADTFRQGKRVVYPRFHFVVMEESQEEAEKACDNVLNILHSLDCEGIKEEIIGASLFLTCLPLNFDFYYEQFVKRTKRLVSDNMADMLPVYGSFRGTDTPAQLYLNRRGEICFLDFFDSDINPHGLVIGSSGAGKSFFINDFILQNFRLGAHFFVLDKGESYKKLCKILKGQYIKFDLNNPVTINPFPKELDSEKLSFLISMLSQMASGRDERDRLSREEEGLLEQAVLFLYEKKKVYEVAVLSDLVRVLESDSFNEKFNKFNNMGSQLALKLTPFTKKGQFGKFFDGKNQFDFNSKFTVFELANLSTYEDLQIVVLLNIISFITNYVSLDEMRAKRKFLFIDEAWSLMKVKNTSEFISCVFKTFRKYRCSAVAITQELSDLTKQDSGLAIQANASNKILLKQEESMVDLLKTNMNLSESGGLALKSVDVVKGKFSEALVLTDKSCGIIRLISDPLLYWIATSEGKDNSFLIKKCKEKNISLMDGLKECAKEFPNGIK